MRAALWWAKYLRSQGVRYAFGQGGLEAVELLEALREAGVEFVWCHHESAAAFAASTMGEITGIPGLCVTTRGPGVTNMLTGVAHALLDRSPLMAVSGDTESTLKGRLPHQNLPLVDVLSPLVKGAWTITADDVSATVPEAFGLAAEDPPGPVYLAFSGAEGRGYADAPDPCSVAPTTWTGPAFDGSDALRLIGESRRPVVMVGLGARQMEWERAIRTVAERLRAPVVATPKAKGHFAEDHPLFAGVFPAYQDGPVKDLIGESDLVVGFGVDPVEMSKPWPWTMPVVNFTPWTIVESYFPCLVSAPAFDQASVVCLADKVEGGGGWSDDAARTTRRELEGLLRPDWRADLPRSWITPHQVLRELRQMLRPDAIVACDVGSHRQLTSQLWQCTWPKTFLTSNGLSSVGYALPAAMAAALVCPDRQIVCLIGDGGLLMSPGELQTIARLSLRVLTIVWADEGSSSTRLEHERSGYANWGGTFAGAADFETLARGLGVWSTTVDGRGDVRRALTDALSQPSASLVQVPISYDVYRGMEL